jgi:hypothetical protein
MNDVHRVTCKFPLCSCAWLRFSARSGQATRPDAACDRTKNPPRATSWDPPSLLNRRDYTIRPPTDEGPPRFVAVANTVAPSHLLKDHKSRRNAATATITHPTLVLRHNRSSSQRAFIENAFVAYLVASMHSTRHENVQFEGVHRIISSLPTGETFVRNFFEQSQAF